MQHLVLIWANRNTSGTIEADKLHFSTDRPKESPVASSAFFSKQATPKKDEKDDKARTSAANTEAKPSPL
jgi:hypothetical protein